MTINDPCLVNYWPILDNRNMSDLVGGAHMTQGSLTSFTFDRFGNPNSALALNGGFTQVPAGLIFNSAQFSTSAWVKPSQVGSWARVFDFGNVNLLLVPSQFVQLSFSDYGSMQPSMVVYGTSQNTKAISSNVLTLETWHFLATTFNGSHLILYVDGGIVSVSVVLDPIAKVQRKSNYFGKSNMVGDGVSHSILDDIRFYNISLSQEQVLQLMNDVNFVSCVSSTITTTASPNLTDLISDGI